MEIKDFLELLKENSPNEIQVRIQNEMNKLKEVELINDALVFLKLFNELMLENKEEIKESLSFFYEKDNDLSFDIGSYNDFNNDGSDFYYFCVEQSDYDKGVFEKFENLFLECFSESECEAIYERNSKIDLNISLDNNNDENILKYILGKELYTKYAYEVMNLKIEAKNEIINSNKNKI